MKDEYKEKVNFLDRTEKDRIRLQKENNYLKGEIGKYKFIKKLLEKEAELNRRDGTDKGCTNPKGCKKYFEGEDRTCGDQYGYYENEKRPYVKKQSSFDIWLCSSCDKTDCTKSRQNKYHLWDECSDKLKGDEKWYN